MCRRAQPYDVVCVASLWSREDDGDALDGVVALVLAPARDSSSFFSLSASKTVVVHEVHEPSMSHAALDDLSTAVRTVDCARDPAEDSVALLLLLPAVENFIAYM